MSIEYDRIQDELNRLQKIGQKRTLRTIEEKDGNFITVNGKKYLNLSSNDYLGITGNDRILSKFTAFLSEKKPDYLGFSSASSRLLTGNHSIYDELEKEIAGFYGRESAIVFNSGYHANLGIVSSIVGKDDAIFSDKLNHASIIDGTILSRAEHFRYKHLDYNHLEEQLKKHRNKYKRALVVSESIFSMDGDRADLRKLIELKDKYNCFLMIDEAHAVGLFGNKGCGICEEDNVTDKIDIIVGTFGKAIASVGAYAVVNELLKEYFINKARSFIFTTALPPVNLFWTLEIIKLLPSLNDKRKHLREISTKLRNSLKEKNLVTRGESHIVPVIIGDNEATVKIAEKLQDAGLWILPIRPPAVPPNSSRLRISLNAENNWEELENIAEIIAGV